MYGSEAIQSLELGGVSAIDIRGGVGGIQDEGRKVSSRRGLEGIINRPIERTSKPKTENLEKKKIIYHNTL